VASGLAVHLLHCKDKLKIPYSLCCGWTCGQQSGAGMSSTAVDVLHMALVHVCVFSCVCHPGNVVTCSQGVCIWN
jgi:hypothetical protein